MRWKIYKTVHEAPWKLWFAWYPVSIGEEKVWMEWVLRRKGPKWNGSDFTTKEYKQGHT